MKLKSHPAVIALASVIALGALVLVLGVMALTTGAGLVQQGFNDTESQEVFAWADSCMEQALRDIRTDGLSYADTDYDVASLNNPLITLRCSTTVIAAADPMTVQLHAHKGLSLPVKYNVCAEFVVSDVVTIESYISDWSYTDCP